MEKIYTLECMQTGEVLFFKSEEEADSAREKLNEKGFDFGTPGYEYVCTSVENDLKLYAELSIWIYKDKIDVRDVYVGLEFSQERLKDGFDFKVRSTLDDTKHRFVEIVFAGSLDNLAEPKNVVERISDAMKEFANEALNRPSAELMEMSKEELHNLIAVVYEKKYKNFVL